jgi:hypothetical protein
VAQRIQGQDAAGFDVAEQRQDEVTGNPEDLARAVALQGVQQFEGEAHGRAQVSKGRAMVDPWGGLRLDHGQSSAEQAVYEENRETSASARVPLLWAREVRCRPPVLSSFRRPCCCVDFVGGRIADV